MKNRVYAFGLGLVGTAVLSLGSVAMASDHQAKLAPVVGGTTVDAASAIAKRTVGLFFVVTVVDDNGKPVLDSTGKPQEAEAFCSGSILDAGHVLTAAHCVQNVKGGAVVFSTDMLGTLGKLSATTPVSAVPELRLMTGIKQEPGYPGGEISGAAEVNDLAVIAFNGGLPAGYEPAKFLSQAASEQALQQGAAVTLAGYGITSPSSPTDSPDDTKGLGILRQVTMKSAGFSDKEVDLYVMGPAGHDACSGDSGGPSMVSVNNEVYVVGVASRSNCSTVSIYTFVNAEAVSGL